MKKELYETPVFETIRFQTEEVLNTSPGGPPVLPDQEFD